MTLKILAVLSLFLLTNLLGEHNVTSSGCQHQLIKIVYGKPSPKLMQLAEEGKVHLGGCMLGEDAPRAYCVKCQKSF